ncbi:PAS domain-containing sensor histidine kinase [Algoriphagus terrigena]|uniref:PAS domain-containing sensor histidine kinase n=1 Tax=Algoriphagus terrigena TaxID=344884 RepID=UPI0003FD9FB2|nr:PAS domain-containing protein [Algoriphagus terrigena]
MGDFPKPTSNTSASTRSDLLTDTVSRIRKIEAFGNIGHWEVDLTTGKNTWSDHLYRILGLDAGDITPGYETAVAAIHPEDRPSAIEMFRRFKRSGASFQIENRIIRPSGEIRHLNSEAVVNYSADGQPLRIFGVTKDISDEKQKEAILRKTDLQLENILNTTQDLIFLADEDGYFLKVSKSCEKILGYSQRELIGKSFRDLIHPEDFEPTVDNRKQIMAGIPSADFQNRYFKKNGSIVYLNWSATLDKTSNIVFAVARDITFQKEEEGRFRELIHRLSVAQKIGKLGYWEFDVQTEEIFWSDEVYNIWGIDQTKFRPNFELFFGTIHPEDQAEFLIHHNNSVAGIAPLDAVHRILLPSGEVKFVHEQGRFEVNLRTGAKRFQGTVQDVTKEKLAEKELRERNLFIESTLKNLPLGIAVTKISTGEATYINPAFWQVYGWAPASFGHVDDFYNNVFPDPEVRNEIMQQIRAGIQSGDPSRLNWKNIAITTQTGEERIVSGKNIPHPELDLLISTVVDDTDRYWAEQALRTSNDRFHLATQATSDAIWDWDINKNFVFWGKGYHTLFGYPEEMNQVSPGFWETKVHPDDLPRIRKSVSDSQNNKEALGWTAEYRFLKTDGSYAFVAENTVILRDSQGLAVRTVGAIRDVTHTKLYEDSLKKLNSDLAASNRELAISNKELEQFAYVASHDLQEPLRMITSFLGLIEKRYAGQLDERGLQYINFAIDGAKRMKTIILDLLEFSRVGNTSESKKTTNTASLLEEVLLLSKKSITEKNATIHIGPLPVILCQGSAIIQLFQNLISNGLKYQAPGNRPEIWIEAKELEHHWQFSVRDNGIGIDPEFRQKIFIIFQRLHQKDQYSGSGIGLAICKKIIEFHGGKIWVESNPGQGSTFHFTITK